ncbi:uncharacterized protein LOC127005736 [Eriocheir sinensis]|uniref:uncharacterized protein LOC127005736 n=1 Tax=Eriocheir sinensis TaxID=95602 RepID=UPI0021C7CE1F|nr:uncharacterized protein LOC127005736 [Eriocheir sinensis]
MPQELETTLRRPQELGEGEFVTSPRTPPEFPDEFNFEMSTRTPQAPTEAEFATSPRGLQEFPEDLNFVTSSRTAQELANGDFATSPRTFQEFPDDLLHFGTPSEPPQEPSAGEFEAEWWVLVVCVIGLACGALTSARLLHHGTSANLRRFPSTAARVLLCSQAAAGLLQVTVASPVLLLALAYCYGGKVCVCVGWASWGWAWGVQGAGALAIAYERVRVMGRPLRGVLAPRTAVILAGAAWACGGAMGVAMGKGLQCTFPSSSSSYSFSSCGHPSVAAAVLVAAFLPLLLLVVLWAQGVRRLRQAPATSTSCPAYVREVPKWRLTTPQPSDNLEAIMFTVSRWAAPLLVAAPSSCSPPPGRPSKPALHAEALLEGSRSPSPVYSRRSSMLEEDTFTVGGIYMGSLKSHIRAHSGFCTDQNVRSQGCQTGEDEASPPVIEWRVLPPTPTLQEPPPVLTAPEVTSVGVQCCSVAQTPSQTPRGGSLAKDFDRLVVWETSVKVESSRAAPALALSAVQALTGVFLPLVVLGLHVGAPGSVWAWWVILLALTVTNPAPALAHCSYFLAEACVRDRLREV